MVGAFLVGNFSIFIASNKWVIIDFRNRFPAMDDFVKDDGTVQIARQDIVEHQSIMINLEQSKDLVEKLKETINDFEKGVKDNIIKKDKKKADSYIG